MPITSSQCAFVFETSCNNGKSVIAFHGHFMLRQHYAVPDIKWVANLRATGSDVKIKPSGSVRTSE